MDATLTQEQQMLRESVSKFCKNDVPLEKVRELADHPNGLTDDLWARIAEQGWLALLIPEEHGGMGLGVQDLAVVCEEMGRNLLPGPYLSTVLAAHAIALGGTDAAKAAWLEKVAAGEARGALALLDSDAVFAASAVNETEASKSGDGFVINGKKYLVADAVAADFFVVAAHDGAGISLFVVDANADGVSVAANKLVDATSRSGQVTLANVKVGADALIGAAGSGWDLVERVVEVANVCIAGASVAGAERILKLTIDYAKERSQFGVLIGSFQAVKHPLARLFAIVESARSAYAYVAWALDANADDRKAAVATARLTCTEAYRRTTLDCLQAHGGIGFTWEYDLHLFLKRAKHNQYQYGTARDYEEVVVKEALGI
jgi:hypothetical protein